MARNALEIRRANRKKIKGRKKKKMLPPASVGDLLEAASSAMESLDVERAYQAYQQAAAQLQIEDPNATIENKKAKAEVLIHVLEKMGECQVSIGDPDVAKGHFLQSLKLLEELSTDSTRNTNFYETHSSLCFYIGQLSLEKEALEAYQRGIRSLEECMKKIEDEGAEATTQDDSEDASMDDGENLASLRQKLSGAYCNLAELYLTDLCEEESAESDCELYLEKALQLKDADGEPLVDALQTMASLRLSQKERQLEAVPFVLRAYEKQRVGSEALAALVGLNVDKQKSEGETEDKAQELVEVEAASNLPEFEFRCQTAKLLLECAGLLKENSMDESSNQEDECVTAAISVLGSLLAQNDEVIEIWYLTGCAFAAKKPVLTDTATFYLERAKEMLTDIRKAMKDEEPYIDDSERAEFMQELEMNESQMKDVQSKLDELPDTGAEMEEDN